MAKGKERKGGMGTRNKEKIEEVEFQTANAMEQLRQKQNPQDWTITRSLVTWRERDVWGLKFLCRWLSSGRGNDVRSYWTAHWGQESTRGTRPMARASIPVTPDEDFTFPVEAPGMSTYLWRTSQRLGHSEQGTGSKTGGHKELRLDL